MTETNPNLPEVGKTYEYRMTPVTVTGVHKRGRGYYVTFDYEAQDTADGPSYEASARARLKDWQAGAQAA